MSLAKYNTCKCFLKYAMHLSGRVSISVRYK